MNRMGNLLNRVIVGNLVINPRILREFLKKSHYFLSYKAEMETIEFQVNDGDGGMTIMEIRNSSYENAVKLAEGLGLSSIDKADKLPTFWSKYNPIFFLYNDGSEDAERLRMEMLRLGLPFRDRGSYYEGGRQCWAWSTGGHIYIPSMWTVDKVLEEIRDCAEKSKDRLNTTP